MPPEEIKRALIVVRTYPVPSRSGIEVSCTAAITDQGEWLRLFPVPWRLLEKDRRFRKYQWVDVTVTKANDVRPESYKLKPDGIRIISEVGTEGFWQARKDIIFPLKVPSLCDLVRRRDAHGYPTLGFFKPKSIDRLTIEADSPTWTANQIDALRQGHLFLEKPEKELEKVPFSFSYEFRCDDAACNGHKMICTDWEIGEAYRKWKTDYGDQWEGKFRRRFESEMISKYDTHLYVGTVHRFPGTWIIVGLFYPGRQQETRQGDLFGPGVV